MLVVSTASLVAFLPLLSFWIVAVGWVFSGLGMGLVTPSTAVAVMSLSRAAEQARNASSLTLSDALGPGVFVGVSGPFLSALSAGGDLQVASATLLPAMSVVGLLATASALRIGV